MRKAGELATLKSSTVSGVAQDEQSNCQDDDGADLRDPATRDRGTRSTFRSGRECGVQLVSGEAECSEPSKRHQYQPKERVHLERDNHGKLIKTGRGNQWSSLRGCLGIQAIGELS